MSRKKLPRNAACPCGSGRKYKNCCYAKGVEGDLALDRWWSEAAQAEAAEEPGAPAPAECRPKRAKPQRETTTKLAAGVILHDGAEPIIKRWVATDVTTNAKVQQELQDFFLQHGVKQEAMTEGNMGCPHEEGLDFPHGEDCPFCPFWKGKQGSRARRR